MEEEEQLVQEPQVDLPPWLKPLIRANFYENCQCGSRYTNYFCSECEGLPFCDKCKNMTHQHDGHDDKVLPVCRASHQPGINNLSLKKLLDISDIQQYVINSKKIVYIPQRRGKENNVQKAGAEEVNRIVKKRCEICGWPKLSLPVRFCSIECKEKGFRKEQKSVKCAKEEKPFKIEEEEYVAPKGSLRKKPRKRVPVRSPLM
ncbi:PLATZ transcription factor family protein [Melia azedarach]|uniref:PLATZ transcription factor family protein n=1 Tax=Melia azedarach TaxID=155640 RepID=A0ACC1XWB5_MELAZ|nr:PLATZ transcription factor family protein [Melia azedarach]